MALSPEERVDLARRGVEMYSSGDVDGALALMHPEIEGFAEGLNTGRFRGLEGFLRWAAEWDEAWERFDRTIERVDAVGERHAIAFVHQTGRGRDSGIEVDQDAAYVFEVDEQSRCVYFALLLDTDRAVAFAQERERERERGVGRMPPAMAVKTEAIGKEWEGEPFEVEGQRIAEYASAVGERNPVHHDAEAARADGFRDQVAPPMFAVVYQFPAMALAGVDPEVGMNLAALVHGGQEFVWGEPVCAGDVISTNIACTEIYERDGKGFYVFEAVSTNQDGAETVRGTWTNIVRGV